jgi:NifB/MoaA-like Fe-S oxidoreductase
MFLKPGYSSPVIQRKLLELEMDIELLEKTLEQLDETQVSRVYMVIGGRVLVEYPPSKSRELIEDELNRLRAWRNKLLSQLN